MVVKFDLFEVQQATSLMVDCLPENDRRQVMVALAVRYGFRLMPKTQVAATAPGLLSSACAATEYCFMRSPKGDLMEAKHKHLDFIQLTITRMAANSFLLKGWCVTLIAALFALASKDARPDFLMIAVFPTLVFWGLDAYFLRQERLYRELYNSVREKTEQDIDYSLDTKSFNSDVANWFCTFFSSTLFSFYAATLITVGIIAWLTKSQAN